MNDEAFSKIDISKLVGKKDQVHVSWMEEHWPFTTKTRVIHWLTEQDLDDKEAYSKFCEDKQELIISIQQEVLRAFHYLFVHWPGHNGQVFCKSQTMDVVRIYECLVSEYCGHDDFGYKPLHEFNILELNAINLLVVLEFENLC
jgi:hypothetical protein